MSTPSIGCNYELPFGLFNVEVWNNETLKRMMHSSVPMSSNPFAQPSMSSTLRARQIVLPCETLSLASSIEGGSKAGGSIGWPNVTSHRFKRQESLDTVYLPILGFRCTAYHTAAPHTAHRTRALFCPDPLPLPSNTP